jgi:hypothetical protein
MNETGEPKIVEFIFPEAMQIIINEPKPLFYDNSGDLAALEFCSAPDDDAVSLALLWIVVALLAGPFCWGVYSNFSEESKALEPVKAEVKQ